MIRFPCQHCGAKLQISPAHAGKESLCPHCKNKLTVPQMPEPELELVKEDTAADTRIPSKLLEDVAIHPQPLPMGRKDDSRENRLAQRLLDLLNPDPAREHTGERRLPWFLDILLYPANLSGIIALVFMAILSLTPHFFPIALFWVGRRFFWGPLGAIGLYIGWYLAECVYDSAKGGTRAPTVFDMGDWDDLLSRVSYLMAVYILFALPPVLYRMLTGRTDAIFWALVAWAIVFLPMGLLALVIHDSVSALNPLFLLGSILRVFRPYLCLLLGTGVLAGLFWYADDRMGRGLGPTALRLFHALLSGYAALVLAHLLGRFYWRYRDRLDWGI